MANSNLLLKIETGPKKGETLTLNPKTLTRIGRVTRGNTLSIRDLGISEKHLTIRFLPESSSWVITDLNSSNGTLINDSLIDPDKPYPLADGDIIKIGEKTSISISISVAKGERSHLSAKDEILQPAHAEKGRGREGRGERSRFSAKDEILQPALVEKVKGREGRGERSRLEAKDEILQSLCAERRATRYFVKKLKEDNGGVEEEVAKDNVKIEWKENDVRVEEEMVNGENRVRVEEVIVDMDNMTLGEWIDSMRVYLPKAINKAAEEVIDQLNEKARLFDEYVDQTSNAIVLD